MKYFGPIPMDLAFEILLRLPVKSVARFLCVSKLWLKIIPSDEFIRSYSLKSSPKKLPRLLCAKKITNQGDWSFFTKSTHVLEPFLDLPKPQPLVVKEESQFVSSSWKRWCSQNPSYAHGLISYLHGNDLIICNPSISKYISLPEPPFVTNDTFITSCFLGYDPINGQYKVLCSAFETKLGFYYHQVLTLGAQNCLWKMIQCSTPVHYPGTRHVCIEGVLYYSAFKKEQVLVRFDLRSESLEVVSVIPEGFLSSQFDSLINYHGKVAVAKKNKNVIYFWVLVDAKKKKWSNKLLTIPTSITHWGYPNDLEILGTSDMGEIVFRNSWFKEVYFLDQTSNHIRSVELKGSTKHKCTYLSKVYTFLHYVESVMFV